MTNPVLHQDGLTLRPYRPEDRDAVRRICFETGYMGESAAWFWKDRDAFADLYTRYYTDEEPESATVVEDGSQVLGYLLGCKQTPEGTHTGRIALGLAARRLLLFKPGTARFHARAALDILREGFPPPRMVDARWPAHFHIDLLEPARGRGVGRALLLQWFERLQQRGVPGVNCGTFAENLRFLAFVASLGMTPHGGAVPLPGYRRSQGERLHRQVLVKSFA